jgi:cytochrome P450
MTKYYGLVCRHILIIIASSFGIVDHNAGFLPYGSLWRRARREFQANLSPADVESYQPIKQRAVHCLLRNLLSSPGNFDQHLRQ